MTEQAAGRDSIKAWREAAHMAASLTLLVITVCSANRQKRGIVDGFIRLSVGIEDVSDLQGDLDRAFHAAK